MILAARRVNDRTGRFVADRDVKTLIRTGCAPLCAKAAVIGLTFKENCADLRNPKVIDIVHHLQDHGLDVQLHDPVADASEAHLHAALKPALKPASKQALKQAFSKAFNTGLNKIANQTTSETETR